VLRHCDHGVSLVIPARLQTIERGHCHSDPTRALTSSLSALGDAFVVAGQLGSGVDGFRRSHHEARAVERLVRLPSGHPPTATAHEHVALEVLLLADLDMDHSLAKVVSAEHISKDAVTYRAQRALTVVVSRMVMARRSGRARCR
jgi:hypothetical protein